MDHSQGDGGADGEKPKNQLTHPDNFLDEMDSDPNADPDSILAEALPQLEKEMKQIQSDFIGLNAEIESLDLDVYREEKVNSKTLKERWLNFKKNFKAKARELTLKVYFHVKYFIIWLVLEVPKKIFKAIKYLAQSFQKLTSIFSKWSGKRKILFITSVIALITTLFVYIKMIKSDFLLRENSTFYGSMEELAENSFSYDLNVKQEPFYNSPRVKVYSFQMKPVIVNLKRKAESEGVSNDNPMAYFEFIFEGNSGDVVVELKERESEFVDVVSRVIETKSYEELETLDGKVAMKEDIRKEINKKINSGIIKKVEIRNFFIKP